jgi:hypothetical protein
VIYTCCDENRRALVDAHATLNGIDRLEVVDLDAPPGSPRQQTLLLRLLKPVPPGLGPENVAIEGGERIRAIGVDWVGIASTPPPEASLAEQDFLAALEQPDQVLVVRTDSTGDFSRYRLRLLQGSGSDLPLADFDPRLSTIGFAFKVECPSDFDCQSAGDCADDPAPAPDIHYLARDYASLRRLVVDRLSRQMPGWRDRSPADLATTLAELIAYVGDLQHYQLDAVTTEAYLHTARRRSSLRRHALLVDYAVHEGSNARTWLHLEVNGAAVPLPEGLRCYTRVPGVPTRIVPGSPDDDRARQGRPLVFEPMHEAVLREAHNRLELHTWGDARCCLPRGATRATLRGHYPHLAAGDVLVFQEIRGPLTGQAEDADPAHRHAVRLTRVNAFDGGSPLTDPLPPDPAEPTNLAEITEIAWAREDALPFPLCISSETDVDHGSELIDDVSIAFGNIVLVDHGLRIAGEALGEVPEPLLHYPNAVGDACVRQPASALAPRFRPLLSEGPVTHQGQVLVTRVEDGEAVSERRAFDPAAPAAAALSWRAADAKPAISLDSGETWLPRRDLLSSDAGDTHFVLESEDDGSARIRFGDGVHGRRPATGLAFTADYRVGNGPEGNTGADTLAHVVTTEDRIVRISNPLPATGGQAPESSAEIRRRAPEAFRTQARAVTPADYAAVSERLDGVQRAAAGLRWTGSWHTMFVTVDREGGLPVAHNDFGGVVVDHLERYRMAGHDLRVNDPVYVSLEIDLLVCVDERYFRSHVRRGLLDVLSSRRRTDGTLGLFHPDNFSFGQTVYLSPVYAAARGVPGVDSVQVTRFQRQGREDPKPLADGFLSLGRLEIARLDNDRNFPEHGVLRLSLHGGK